MVSFVLDVDVLVDGCRGGDGDSRALLAKIARGELKAHCSPELYADYDGALRRAASLGEISLSVAEASQLLEGFGGYHIIGVDIDPRLYVDLSAMEPELVHVIATALAADVDIIVTNRPERFETLLSQGRLRAVRPANLI